MKDTETTDDYLRDRVQQQWNVFDSCSLDLEASSKVFVRALDILASTKVAFAAPENEAEADVDITEVSPVQQLVRSLPRGDVNASDNIRGAYFRAEESLALAHEQLSRNRETLARMAGVVEEATRIIGRYYLSPRGTAFEGGGEGGYEALDRGKYGCGMSPVEMTRVMGTVLSRNQSEYELQETIMNSVGYDTPDQVLTTYSTSIATQPFLDARFIKQVKEIWLKKSNLLILSRGGQTQQSAILNATELWDMPRVAVMPCSKQQVL
ncbi:unnamed protein product [Choristocarpus tenellus]